MGDLGTVVPRGGLAGIGVLDLPGGEDLPVLLNLAGGDLLLVDEDLVGLVGVDNEGVDVGGLVALSLDLLLDEVVGVLVGQDDMDLLGGTADVGAEHDVVSGVAIEVGLVKAGGEELDVATTAVEVLLVLDGELEDEVLALILEGGRELGGDRVEAGILRGLETEILGGIAVVLAMGDLKVKEKKKEKNSLDFALKRKKKKRKDLEKKEIKGTGD